MTTTSTSRRPTPKFRLAEILLAGKGIDLTTWLTDQREADHSLEQIARDLYVETDQEVSVTLQTIGRWLQDLAA